MVLDTKTTVSYGMFACILFNHESRRGETLHVKSLVATCLRKRQLLYWKPDSQRDWGHAKDYVEPWRILQQDIPEDYVIAMV
jgi:GDPmannose 4,6-dehydratase